MGKVRNILFIMCDQLRYDYLSCNGHPHLDTPHIDGLAAKGVNFVNAFVQSPLCGPSRMSYLTGRYVHSHGATWNGVPLSVGQTNIGDFMRPHGLRCALVGKTHMEPDADGMTRLGVDKMSSLGVLTSECGLEPVERDDGLWPDKLVDPNYAYNDFLKSKGYDGDNPWHDWANAAEGPNGEILSGWYLSSNHLPARVREEDSETPYMTGRAIEFMEAQGDHPFLLHLSYIKPHWPYIVPAPYHNMHGHNQILPPVRSDAERDNAHPVLEAHMKHPESLNFSIDNVRDNVMPAYMGLIKQIDEQMGRLFSWMEDAGRMDDTMIVFTSDHGDYLGDHWLGEKEMLHECSIRVPMIVYDPDTAADSTRGTKDETLVESLDMIPTFLDAFGGLVDKEHLLEGESLLPTMRGAQEVELRDAVFAEIDYSFKPARKYTGKEPAEARGFMIRTYRWKYLLWEGYRSQLFDLENDPNEFDDLGESADHANIRAELHERLFRWLRTRATRITISEEAVRHRTGGAPKQGIIIGEWSPEETIKGDPNSDYWVE
ncbi:MAG: phosphonate monoester hydrolase [Rhodospirillaceae bacterium]|nr:MAG: phosphonate monoester hydrolase [Rhodospirillaceae bacterium]